MFKWLRKRWIPEFGINRDHMNTVLQNKKLSRLKKSQESNKDLLDTKLGEFEGFTIGAASAPIFFEKLNKNLSKFADHTRFQLAIQDMNHHFWMVDCYINKGILHTLTVDAFVLPSETAMLVELSAAVPNGVHYAFHKENMQSSIQRDHTSCQSFTREHISVVSKMDPEHLYRSLSAAKKFKTVKVEHVDGLGQPLRNLKIFTIDMLTPNESVLAPIFRCMQSLSTMQKLPDSFRTSIVSKKPSKLTPGTQGKSFTEWVDDNTLNQRNHAIKNKRNKYFKELKQCDTDFNNDRSGFGFITFPILTRVKKILIDAPQETCHELSSLVIKALLRMPRHTHTLSFLGLRAKHADKIDETFDALKALYRDRKTMDKEHYILGFCNIIYKFAGYLDKHQSVRTIKALNEVFEAFELSKQNEIHPIFRKAGESG